MILYAACKGNHPCQASQVCLRWVLQHGAVMAVGTGSSAATVGPYAAADLDNFGFELSRAEMGRLNAL
jgi:diketogulonate reductase-like aldo/keto reductase